MDGVERCKYIKARSSESFVLLHEIIVIILLVHTRCILDYAQSLIANIVPSKSRYSLVSQISLASIRPVDINFLPSTFLYNRAKPSSFHKRCNKRLLSHDIPRWKANHIRFIGILSLWQLLTNHWTQRNTLYHLYSIRLQKKSTICSFLRKSTFLKYSIIYFLRCLKIIPT